MIFQPHNYQSRAIAFVQSHPRAALFLDMGLGKTVSTLTAVRAMQDILEIGRVLVIAPLSVARNTWTSECSKWNHLNNTRISVVLGTAKERTDALETSADIYVTNRENTVWLCDYFENKLSPFFDMIVIDESSSFKAHDSKRFKALKKASASVPRMVILTGTPSPNGYQDLWAQFRLLDGGKRLGTTWTGFLGTYFHPLFGNGRVTYKYGINVGAAQTITDRIADITLSMKAADYLELPESTTIDYPVSFDKTLLKDYHDFKRDLVLEVGENQLTAETAVALSNKLHQYTSGEVYDENHMGVFIHDEKTAALAELVETAQASGENVLVFYQYRHELPRIMEALKTYRPVHFSGEPDTLRKWNEGKIKVLLAHPASVSYGLNMQGGGHVIVWFSLTWSLEQYQQANARLHRQGQNAPVRIYRLVVKDTIDETISTALLNKDNLQEALLQNLKENTIFTA